MTPTTADRFRGDPLPIPTERFNTRETASPNAAEAFVTGAAEKAREIGQDALAAQLTQMLDKPTASAPAGVHAEHHRQNEEVNAFMRQNPDATFAQALREITGEQPTKGVDPDRESMNRAVEDRMARTGCSFDAALRHIEQEGTA